MKINYSATTASMLFVAFMAPLLLAFSIGSRAQAKPTKPTKPVKAIVPFGAGSGIQPE